MHIKEEAKSRPISKGRRLKPTGRSLKELNELLNKLQADPVFQSLGLPARYIVSEGIRVFFGGDGTGEIMQAKQAELLGLERKTIQRAWKKAVDAGICSCEKQHWANSGKKAHSRYTLAERFLGTLEVPSPLGTIQVHGTRDILGTAEHNRTLEQNKINTKTKVLEQDSTNRKTRKTELNKTYKTRPGGFDFFFSSRTFIPFYKPNLVVLEQNKTLGLGTLQVPSVEDGPVVRLATGSVKSTTVVSSTSDTGVPVNVRSRIEELVEKHKQKYDTPGMDEFMSRRREIGAAERARAARGDDDDRGEGL